MGQMPGRCERDVTMRTSRLGAFIALGAGIGVAIGAGAHRIGEGLALGTALGVAIGAIADRRLR